MIFKTFEEAKDYVENNSQLLIDTYINKTVIGSKWYDKLLDFVKIMLK